MKIRLSWVHPWERLFPIHKLQVIPFPF